MEGTEGTYTDPANTPGLLPGDPNARIIPSFLFDDGDPSEHIFDYLSSPILQYPQVHVSNWTAACSDPETIFASASAAGPFVGCLLYPNVTRGVGTGSVPLNETETSFLTDLHYLSNSSEKISSDLRSTYTTCLAGYCASQAECASSDLCNVGNLLTTNCELSAQGIAKCWLKICTPSVQHANADIAGVGILISYLTQSCIALLGLLSLAILGYAVYRKQRNMTKGRLTRGLTGLTPNDESPNPTKAQKIRKSAEDHYIVVCATVAEFHKAQCYFTIALQIATFVINYSKTAPVVSIDQDFLLLVAVDGLLPVVLTLYTLMAFGKRSWYMIGLSIIPVVLSTVNGIHITHSFSSLTDVKGIGPATCGNVGPVGLCYAIGKNAYSIDPTLASRYYYLIMSIMDIFAGCLVLWKVLSGSTNWWSRLTQRIAKRFVARSKSTSGLTADELDRSSKLNGRIQLWIAIVLHFIIVATTVACLRIEFSLFQILLTSPFIDVKSWGFGQIVGITIWMGVMMELAYLEYNGIEEGLEWRLPKWIKVEEHETKPGHLVITMEEMEFGQP